MPWGFSKQHGTARRHEARVIAAALIWGGCAGTPGSEGGANLNICNTSKSAGDCIQAGGKHVFEGDGGGAPNDIDGGTSDIEPVPLCDPSNTAVIGNEIVDELFLSVAPPFGDTGPEQTCGAALAAYDATVFPRPVRARVEGTCLTITDLATGRATVFTDESVQRDEGSNITGGRGALMLGNRAARVEMSVIFPPTLPGEPFGVVAEYSITTKGAGLCAQGVEHFAYVPYGEGHGAFSCDEVRFSRAYGEVVAAAGSDFVVTGAERFRAESVTVLLAENCGEPLPMGEHEGVTVSFLPVPGAVAGDGCIGGEDTGTGEEIVLGCDDGVMFPIAGDADKLGYFCPRSNAQPALDSFFAGVITPGAPDAATLMMRFEGGTPCATIAFRARLAPAVEP